MNYNTNMETQKNQNKENKEIKCKICNKILTSSCDKLWKAKDGEWHVNECMKCIYPDIHK